MYPTNLRVNLGANLLAGLRDAKLGWANRLFEVTTRFAKCRALGARNPLKTSRRSKVSIVVSLALAATLSGFASPSGAQDQKNNKKKDGNASAAMLSLPTSDTQAID